MPLQLTSGPVVEPVSLLEAKAHLRVDIPDDDALISALITAAGHYAETLTRRAFIAQSWKLVLDSFPGPTLIGIPLGETVHPARPRHHPRKITGPCGQRHPVSGHEWRQSDHATGQLHRGLFIGAMPDHPGVRSDLAHSTPSDRGHRGGFCGRICRPLHCRYGQQHYLDTGAVVPDATFCALQFRRCVAHPIATCYQLLDSVNAGARVVHPDSQSRGCAPHPHRQRFRYQPGGCCIKAWIKVRIGALYQHREEIATTGRGEKIEPLPFMDRLLDPYRVVF